MEKILLNKERWLTEMPELIYKLKKEYGFYYSGWYSNIRRNIFEVINDKKNLKNRHRIVLYHHKGMFYLVVYRKKDTIIYETGEYYHDTKWNRVKYFTNKFEKFYAKAVKELENDLFKSCSSQWGNI